jgi:hypothetical protein
MKTLIVDTTPYDLEQVNTVNFGLQIVKDSWNADVIKWSKKVNWEQYSAIGFNIFYPLQIINAMAFLRINKIEPLKNRRNGLPVIIAGGQGIGNNWILKDIVDSTFCGEYDYKENKDEIVTNPFINNNKNGIIELTRGCRLKCAFCEYSWNTCKYREKQLNLAKKQIDWLVKNGARTVNFMSANFAGYSKFDELIQYAMSKKIFVANSDTCMFYINNIIKYQNYLQKNVRTGIESFDEQTRKRIGKGFTNDFMLDSIQKMMSYMTTLHFYLIYGLPNDNYQEWYNWVNIIGQMRKGCSHNIRIDFSITNFQPSSRTPLENAPLVDFDAKKEFVIRWATVLQDNGFIKDAKRFIEYNCFGRCGQTETTYRLLMALKRGGPELTDVLINGIRRGLKSYVKPQIAERFLNYGKTNKAL